MAEGRDDFVSIRVGKKLRVLPPAYAECNIFRVPNQLRKENDEAYEPQMLAIGPYHRGKDNLKPMEEHKMRYLQLLLQRRNENNVARYVIALRALEERARKCYAESVSINSDDFVEMMLLDGCFIVESIRKFTIEELRDENDPIFKVGRIRNSVKRDMLLLENQLPFFVLWELFGMTVIPDQQINFTRMIPDFFQEVPSGSTFKPVDEYPIEGIKHLLGFIHDSRFSLNLTMKSKKGWKPIRCATELKEAGVKFRKVDRDLFDIRFENGIMEIPPITIEDRTESFFRNLIAYEQCSLDKIPVYVCDYVIVMDCLINSAKDAELLVLCGIINNLLGDDEVVAKIVNKLSNYLAVDLDDFNYSDVFNKLNKHCSKRWNVWKAILSHKYFNSPWALLSVLAAVVLLVLTVAQTIYSVLSYYK